MGPGRRHARRTGRGCEVSDRIQELAGFIQSRIPALFDEARQQITDAIHATVEDAQEEQKDAILGLSISVKWNLDGNTVVVGMPVNVRRKFEQVGKLEDRQEKLPGMEEE